MILISALAISAFVVPGDSIFWFWKGTWALLTHSRLRVPSQIGLIIVMWSVFALGCGYSRVATEPEWVKQNGVTSAYPAKQFVVGFAQASGREEAIEGLKQQAAADLARQITVEIESSVDDLVNESNGKLDNELTVHVRSTSDIQLDGIRFEVHRRRKKVSVIAVVERLPAALRRRKLGDRSLVQLESCVAEADRESEAGRAQQAIELYRSCRRHLAEGLEHEAVASALVVGALLQDQAAGRFTTHAAHINERVRAIPHEHAKAIQSAADALAIQLARAGIGRGQLVQVPPFIYRGFDVSSPLGRELASAVETGIGRTRARSDSGSDLNRNELVLIRGNYFEGSSGETATYSIRVIARQASSGRLLASAEIALEQSAVPKNLRSKPDNFEQYIQDSQKLAAGEFISGDLRVDLRTNKGTRGLVFHKGEELSLFVRVNQPAWVKLVYVLATGDHVAVDQGWYIDADKANQFVEYPQSFEVVAPFGVEMLHAMVYTERPDILRTRVKRISGEEYRVIDGGANEVIRLRGISSKRKSQLAESTVALTTLDRK
jgi:hypothetical protein